MNDQKSGNPWPLRGAGMAALVFGAMTLIEGGKTLALAPQSQPAGLVPMVLYFNSIAGFFYLLAGAGILGAKAWARSLALVLAGATILVFLALGLHIHRGGDYMPRTVGAMTLRSVFWTLQAWFLARSQR